MTTDNLRERLRKAFDADSVAEKNLAIRAAYDALAELRKDAVADAWMYSHGDESVIYRKRVALPGLVEETPLFAHPPVPPAVGSGNVDYEAEFEAAMLARDEAGYLGTSPSETIRHLSEELRALTAHPPVPPVRNSTPEEQAKAIEFAKALDDEDGGYPVPPVQSGDEFRPCPFCGEEPMIEDGENDRPWVVQCLNQECPTQPFMDHADSKRQAAAAWNTRAVERFLNAAVLTKSRDVEVLKATLRSVREYVECTGRAGWYDEGGCDEALAEIDAILTANPQPDQGEE